MSDRIELQRTAIEIREASTRVELVQPTSGGGGNVTIGQDDPSPVSAPTLWLETNPDGTAKTMWLVT